MPTRGSQKLIKTMSPVDQELAQDIAAPFASAIRVAEGNPNFGVLYEQGDPRTIAENSVVNNMARWRAAGSPGKMIDFMQKRWAPIGAANDPNNLNKNWAGNVRGALQKDPNVDYELLKEWNLVKNPMDNFTAVA